MGFGQVPDDFMMDNVECEGTEEKLLDCNHKTKDNCNGNEGLGVICTPKKGETEQCPKGWKALAGGCYKFLTEKKITWRANKANKENNTAAALRLANLLQTHFGR